MDSHTLASLSNVSSQVKSALQKDNLGIIEKGTRDKVVKYPSVAQTSRPKTAGFDLNTGGNFKTPNIATTLPVVSSRVVNTAVSTSMVTQEGVIIPSSSSSWDVPFGGFGEAPPQGGFQAGFVGSTAQQLGYNNTITHFSSPNFFSSPSTFGISTSRSTGFQPSLPSVGQYINTIKHR